MADIVLALDVTQASDGVMNIYNRTSGDTIGKTFLLGIVLKKSSEKVSLTPQVEEASQQWSLKPSLDGWYQFTLTMKQGTTIEQEIKCDMVSLYYGYKCLNSLLLTQGCGCLDVDKWGNIYFKLAAAKAAACNCMYTEAQCILENLDKACKGC
jgi:hypothetical protein